MKTTVSIEYINWLESERARINKLYLPDIEFTIFGEPIDVDEKTMEDFCLTGLSNMDFVLSNYIKLRR